MFANVLAYPVPVSVPEYGQSFDESRLVFPLLCNYLAPLGFGDRNALCSYVNAREQLDSRPNLILHLGLFSRPSQLLGENAR